MNEKEKHIFIMGSKGLMRNYGGWETFVKNLLNNWQDESYQFYVPEIVHSRLDEKMVNYNGIICPQIYAPKIGGATMVVFCAKAFLGALDYVKKNTLENVIFYILGLRIGPLVYLYRKKINVLGVKIIINPDGMEWKRSKWNTIVKSYFLFSEMAMYRSSDLIICDSQVIESYIRKKYAKVNLNTTYISYGAIVHDKAALFQITLDYFHTYNMRSNSYYLLVGRFVPENNYQLIIEEFMQSTTTLDLVIICNVEINKFYIKLKDQTHFDMDSRIKFVGTVYNQSLLTQIRNHAFAYIHGHSAGGTNPSLLEALGTTKINILFDAEFNREVGANAAEYFGDKKGSLVETLLRVESFPQTKVEILSEKAKTIIRTKYSWCLVVDRHIEAFESLLKSKF